MDTYNRLRYHIIPPIFLICFTFATQVFIYLGNPANAVSAFNLGSPFAWKTVATFFLWAFLSQKVPAKTFHGPPAQNTGYVPQYAANGTQYYAVSIAAWTILIVLRPEICVWIYDDFAAILNCLNISALLICLVLLFKGKHYPTVPEKYDTDLPTLYLFYRGIELHPRILGIDVKQWAICRVGMMGWALLVLTFAVAGEMKNAEMPLNVGNWANAVLINIFLLKFFYWETGYFDTLDITLDRAGYYLCWGCICWVQIFYTFSAFFMVAHPSQCSVVEVIAIVVLGLVSLLLNYAVDRQKEVFRATGGKCHIWARPAKAMVVTYKDATGKTKKSNLLLSGYWGVARHLNYTFEIIHSLTWSLPACHYGILPFSYVIFLTVLLTHRTFRDDEKCKNKYGDGWTRYCEKVPYKLIPYVY